MANPIILVAIPVFFTLIALELLTDKLKGTHYIRLNDSFGSLALGTWSLSTKVLFVGIGAWVYQDLFNGFTLINEIQMSWISWLGLFVLYDFCYYWLHRAGHQINFFWASHAIHHQSEEYNLTTALRQTSSGFLGWIFYLPIYILGAPAEAVASVGALNLVYQFWVHTRHVHRLGPLEWLLVTPSNHRVHHGQNPEYIDKNMGGVFIVWDRLFGTFKDEVDGIETIYGVRRPLNSFNPFSANIQVWWSLFTDAMHTKRWADKLVIWFKPTGWRPEDRELTAPIAKTNLENFVPYNPRSSWPVNIYAFVQLVISMVISTAFVAAFSPVSYAHLLTIWLLVSVPFITVAGILQDERWGYLSEWLRQLFVIAVAFNSNWSTVQLSYALMAWAALSILGLFSVHVYQLRRRRYERSDQFSIQRAD